MSKKSILLFLALILCCIPRLSTTSELYFLDNSQVLIYKIINWWYHAPTEESGQLCGKNLRYVNTGESNVSYVENGSAIKISIDDGFASMLSIVKECEACSKPYSSQSAWLNDEYFPGASATLTIEESVFTNEYSILIEKTTNGTFAKIKGNKKQLVFTLIGRVQGLQNGKVALNPKSDFLKKCFDEGPKKSPGSLVYLVVTNSVDGSTLMKFNILVPISGLADLQH